MNGAEPLYVAMTRPAMRWGVALEWLMLNIMFTSMVFLKFKNLLVLPVCLPIHVLGMLIARSDPNFFAVWRVKLQRCRSLRSASIYGRNVYDP
jgi:type IV secretion system protein VirB3